MSGSIIPTPLAIPTSCAGPSPIVHRATLARVSVVMIAAAASSNVAAAPDGHSTSSKCERSRSIG